MVEAICCNCCVLCWERGRIGAESGRDWVLNDVAT